MQANYRRSNYAELPSVCEEALIHKQPLTEDQKIQRTTFFKRIGKKPDDICFERNEKSIAKYIDSLGIFSSIRLGTARRRKLLICMKAELM